MIDFLLGVPGKLKTITDYLTTYMAAARMAKIDNCDVASSSRAAASSAVSNAYYTNARGPFLDKLDAGGIPGTVKSIQTGTIASVGNGTTATIAAVNTAKSVLIHLGCSVTSGSTGSDVVRIALTSSTTVAGYRNISGDSVVAVGFMVVEYY